MITCIIIVTLALFWLGYETRWLQVKLNTEPSTFTYPGSYVSSMMDELQKQTLLVNGSRLKPQAVKLGHGIYDFKLMKRHISSIPGEAAVDFRQDKKGKLYCRWNNGKSDSWALPSCRNSRLYVIMDGKPALAGRRDYPVTRPKDFAFAVSAPLQVADV